MNCADAVPHQSSIGKCPRTTAGVYTVAASARGPSVVAQCASSLDWRLCRRDRWSVWGRSSIFAVPLYGKFQRYRHVWYCGTWVENVDGCQLLLHCRKPCQQPHVQLRRTLEAGIVGRAGNAILSSCANYGVNAAATIGGGIIGLVDAGRIRCLNLRERKLILNCYDARFPTVQPVGRPNTGAQKRRSSSAIRTRMSSTPLVILGPTAGWRTITFENVHIVGGPYINTGGTGGLPTVTGNGGALALYGAGNIGRIWGLGRIEVPLTPSSAKPLDRAVAHPPCFEALLTSGLRASHPSSSSQVTTKGPHPSLISTR